MSPQPRVPVRTSLLLRWLVPERNPAGTVYGTVTVGVLLAAESGLRDTYAETFGSLVLGMVLYWFAHSYADVLGLRLMRQQTLTGGELWHTFVQDWAIVRGGLAPILAVLVGWVAGAEQQLTVNVGVWVAVASLIGLELAAGMRSKARAPEMALQIAVGATFGVGILALRALLH